MTAEAGSPLPITCHEAARLYATHGWRVVPIAPKGKHPHLEAWQTNATNDLALIDNWWTGVYRDHGVGLLMGSYIPPLNESRNVIAAGQGHVFALDVDITDGKLGQETLRDLEDSYSELPETVEQQTGSGGRHLLYRAPEGVEIRNDAGRKLGPGLDIRGIGGQIVAAPTIHPNGQPYAWIWECAPWEREVADAPGWLIALLTRDDPAEAGPSPNLDNAAASRGAPTQDRPGDRFNHATNWPTLLENDGWTRNRDGPEGEQRWTRPGKTTRDGISATVGYKGSDVLKVFTSSVPSLEQDRTYDRFGYWAATRHHGNIALAAIALNAEHRQNLAGIIGTWTPPTMADEPLPPPGSINPYLAALLDWHALYRRDVVELESWDGDGLLIKGRHTALVAKGGDGKSLLAVDIVARIATRPDGPCVLYVDWEMGEEDVYTRAVDLGYAPSDLQGHLQYAHLPIAAGLDTVPGAQLLLEAIDQIKPQIVVLDTYSRAVDGEENDADTVRSLYKNFSLPLRAGGIDQFRLDHLGKDPDRGARGTSAKNDDVDQVWQLTAKGKGVDLILRKNRANSKIQELHYRRVEAPVLHHIRVDHPILGEINHDLLDALEDHDAPLGMTRQTLKEWLRERAIAPGDTNKVMPSYREHEQRILTASLSDLPQSDQAVCDDPSQTKIPNQTETRLADQAENKQVTDLFADQTEIRQADRPTRSALRTPYVGSADRADQDQPFNLLD